MFLFSRSSRLKVMQVDRMDATQQIEDPFSEEEDNGEKEEYKEGSEREQVATLKVFKNDHVPERGERKSFTLHLIVPLFPTFKVFDNFILFNV